MSDSFNHYEQAYSEHGEEAALSNMYSRRKVSSTPPTCRNCGSIIVFQKRNDGRWNILGMDGEFHKCAQWFWHKVSRDIIGEIGKKEADHCLTLLVRHTLFIHKLDGTAAEPWVTHCLTNKEEDDLWQGNCTNLLEFLEDFQS